MTDRDEPAFDDPGHDELRRLLASARVDGPVPEDVARRLDDTLAELRRTEGADGTDDARGADAVDDGRGDRGVVVPLPRRLAPRLLVAAASLLVLGGLGGVAAQQLGQSTGGSEASGDAASATASRSGDAATGQDRAESLARTDLPQVRPDHLRVDVERVVADSTAFRSLVPLEGASAGAGPRASEPAPQADGVACPGPSGVLGVSTVVRYGAVPAALVLGPAGPDGRRTVEIWSCSGDERLARTVVPAVG